MRSPVVGLDIGTSKVRIVVGEGRDDGMIMITGIGEAESRGIKKGIITDVKLAVDSIRRALRNAEASSHVSIREVYLAISGNHVKAEINNGTVPISNNEDGVTDEDIDRVTEIAGTVNLPSEREKLHVFHRYFFVDNGEPVIDPRGLHGAKLHGEVMVVHFLRSVAQTLINTVRQVPLDIADVVFSGVCCAMSVLTPAEKKEGVLLIDIGGGVTEYIGYVDSVVNCMGVIGVGGDHITSDISVAFNLPMNQAEILKKEHGHYLTEYETSKPRVTLPPAPGFSGRTVNLKSLHVVMNARMEEILQIIKKEIDKFHLLHRLRSGVVFVGGGGRGNGLIELAEKIFGVRCRIGGPKNINGVSRVLEPEYSVGVGLVEYGLKVEGDKKSLLEKIFSCFRRMIG